ncbi:hypothetical protein Tco_1407429 [Tanacetum coccineum]
MLKRRKSSKIINCDVITQKGPISLKVYREDETIEVIANLKVSDLHLAEWREVVQACPDRKEKGWKTIYGLIKTRMEYLDQTERELKIDFNKPLKEQDPLNELNELANKKRKRTSDLKDHSSGTETEEGLCQFTLSEALAKKQAPFGVSDEMLRTYTSFLLGAIRTISLLALETVPCLSSNLFLTSVGIEGVVGSVSLTVIVPETLLFKESCVSGFCKYHATKALVFLLKSGLKGVNDSTLDLGKASEWFLGGGKRGKGFCFES